MRVQTLGALGAVTPEQDATLSVQSQTLTDSVNRLEGAIAALRSQGKPTMEFDVQAHDLATAAYTWSTTTHTDFDGAMEQASVIHAQINQLLGQVNAAASSTGGWKIVVYTVGGLAVAGGLISLIYYGLKPQARRRRRNIRRRR